MTRSMCGRADLVRVLAGRGPTLLPVVAGMLGYEPAAPARETPAAPPVPLAPSEVSPAEYTVQAAPLLNIPVWRVESLDVLDRYRPPPPPPPPPPLDTGPPPEFHPLSSWQALLPRLRRVATEQAERRELDVDALVDRLSTGRALEHLPRKTRWRWGEGVQVIQDRSQHLVPFWRDQDLVLAALRGLYPRHAFETAVIHEGLPEPIFVRHRQGLRRYRLPSPGALVLVLGDLACLQQGGEHRRRLWAQLGRRLAQNGNRLLALVPCPADRAQAEIGPQWHVLPWERPHHVRITRPLGSAELAARALRLLRLVSPATRVEPELLRAVRLLLTDVPLDAGAESDVWQHPALIGSSCVAATLDPDEAKDLRRDFAREPERLRREVMELIRRWRTGLPPEIWYEEVLSLDADSRRLLPDVRDVHRGEQFFARLPHELETSGDAEAEGCTRAWIRRWSRRLPPSAWTNERAGSALRQLWWIVHGLDQDAVPPPGFDPHEIPAPSGPVHEWCLGQVGSRLAFTRPSRPGSEGNAAVGSPLATIRTRSALVHVGPSASPTFWRTARPPDWAADWGQDPHGLWVEFEIGGVRQRMRWIESGTFQMGSPQDEPGRWSDEGPQHKVTIGRGYWLFDTACTQALWQAVMGDNPSRFQSPDRPVEQVSWEDCQRFLAKINQLTPGLDLSLPTEAQWEYACRAGTDAATYAGPLEILGENNGPALDGIAWYGGNSGVEFELDNGDDSSDWPKKQYDHQRAGSHPVRTKRPNDWGLYDMLGNVYEWCHDGLRKYTPGASTDPVGPTQGGADRVLRGGSWRSRARDVRCAYRSAIPPGYRFGIFGFRPARVQQSQGQAAAQKSAEPAGPALGRVAEQRPTQDQPSGAAHVDASLRDARITLGETEPGGAQLVRLSGTSVANCPLPKAPALVIATDCEKLTFRQITRPEWASAIGRDRFGLWVEFELPTTKGKKPVKQRMRWIPPGRFRMGSPSDEPGRTTSEEVRQYSPYWPDEGPQHLVTMSQGYWLFDTPCTQALWEAVMGNNPSQYQSPSRPVEQVSWDDCQRFLERVNGLAPGLDLVLPTEAQWEYACRAGTDTATYAGPLQILGENNAPALDPIAWYGGNSGVDFELENGFDVSTWPNKQYDHQKAGTHSVAQKVPNPWGLYDILGNVWEWSLDGPRRYTDDSAVDPVGELRGADRVLRGGSWYSLARSVRCAYRRAFHPGARGGNIGFRPARVQQSQEKVGASVPRAEPAGPALGRVAEQRPTQDQPGGAVVGKKRRRKR